jgi:hypothetical protein
MKRIKILFPLLASTVVFTAQAQNIFPTNGNVGIGIPMPETFLHLKTNGAAAYPSKSSRGNIMQLFQADNNDLEIGVSNALNTRKAWLLARHLSIPDYGQYYSTLHLQPKIDEMGFYRGVAIGYEAYADVPYGVGLAVEGNVGIGTINPQDKLSVKGKIRAHEIRVTTAVADWPDYVFKSDYKVPLLSETEQFIKTYGHLPEVPDAAEVQKNGVLLGEMNKILLKKIEELTLIIIEKDKQLSSQQEQINEIKKFVGLKD